MSLSKSTIVFQRLHMARSFAPLFGVFTLLFFLNAALLAILARQFRLEDEKSSVYVSATGFLLAALITIIGWAIGAWVAHRNARMQNTFTIIGARFSQATFVQQLTTFNSRFGDEVSPQVSIEQMRELSASGAKEDRDALQSAKYILNYFEFISSGIVSGEIDLDIVRNNIRSNILHYFGKCAPYILSVEEQDPSVLVNLRALQYYLKNQV